MSYEMITEDMRIKLDVIGIKKENGSISVQHDKIGVNTLYINESAFYADVKKVNPKAKAVVIESILG